MPTSVSTLNPLAIRKTLGRHQWTPPIQFGPDGWKFDNPDTGLRVIVTSAPRPDTTTDHTEWVHASMSGVDRVPTWDEMCLLKQAVWGDRGEAYQIHPPLSDHVNVHPYALHLWGRGDGARVLPNFGVMGLI